MYTAWIIYHENNNSLIKEKMRRVIGCKRTDARNGEQKRGIELFFRSSFEPNNPHHLKRANVFFGVISDSKFSLLYLRTITREESERQFLTIRWCWRILTQQRHWKALLDRGRARKRHWTVSRSYSELLASFPPPLLRLQTVLDRTFSSCLDKGLRAGLDSPGNRSIVRFIENKVV